MKDVVIQYLSGIILTTLGLFIGFTYSIEEPYYIGENYALIYIALLNALWLIPYMVFYIRTRKRKNAFVVCVLYALFVLPVGGYRFYKRPFDSEKWKSELNTYSFYDGHPAHKNGDMVADLLESRRLIGLPVEQVRKILGDNFFVKTGENRTTLFYFYSNKNIFDGCDKLYVVIQQGVCTEADFGGCD